MGTVAIELDGPVCILRLNRPDVLNAVNAELIAGLRRGLVHSQEPDIRSVLLASATPRAFCAGVDLGYLERLSNEDAAAFFREVAALLTELAAFPKPIVAAVRGYAFGAGADLACACDLRVVGEGSRIRFPGMQFGVVLGLRRLAALAGHGRALTMCLTGRELQASEALAWGLATDLVPDEEVEHRGLTLAHQVAMVPGHAIGLAKQQLREPPYDQDAAYAERSVAHGDFQARLQAYRGRLAARKAQTK